MDQFAGIIIGLVGILLGILLLYVTLKNVIPTSIQIWWLPKEMNGEFINRFLVGIVGFGFLIVGLIFLIGSIALNI